MQHKLDIAACLAQKYVAHDAMRLFMPVGCWAACIWVGVTCLTLLLFEAIMHAAEMLACLYDREACMHERLLRDSGEVTFMDHVCVMRAALRKPWLPHRQA